MKRLLPFLLVIVFMKDGREFKYPTATGAQTVGGSSHMFGADTPDTVLEIYRQWKENPSDIFFRFKLFASFNLSAVERWEEQN